ncbi:MAG TPA: biotin--[acetyl-CoA-carboxylase] ligase [Anaerolineales bacterium]|nr:biotin--[acetyl-CoA-carboxylase] ligase [Anaerolineales bacterium]
MVGVALRYNARMRYGEELRATLPAGGFGEVLYAYDSIASTNSRAAELAMDGAAEGTLVVADHQTHGRGRGGTRWYTPPGSAVAMSLILRPAAAWGLRWTGLGALAVAEALKGEGLPAQIKWPNDVLIEGGKVAGVLVEAAWEGNRPLHLILGIGIDVGADSVQKLGSLSFPAKAVEAHVGRMVSRTQLIASVLRSLETWYPRVGTEAFLDAWEGALAFKGGRVQVETGDRLLEGRLLGLGRDGEARIELASGEVVFAGGEASNLRPARG